MPVKPTVPPVSVETVVINDTTLQFYHERWGHQDKRHVSNKLKLDLGIEVKFDNSRPICESCIVGKSTCLPFGNREKVKRCGVLSTDTVGPLVPYFSGN